MPSRYDITGSDIPQPVRKILPSYTDIIHVLRMGERVDNLSQKYYNTPDKGWVIMCANPEYDNELEIPIGAKVRVPFPLQRVWDSWILNSEI